ncbi:NAD(P)/FAD-dependent oxidoreductase [Mangrovimicrobium sediminis]|uniref:NAD(P)/FAD-dependent oxidoreductase n=1 Tax=Mangrovimicrobium sediminis TaxID=2562682 RepID=A0A4Z0LVI7_9GAMM|nr:NAD(P)/FAD-dependent oxidoreductase [Haliea sp. SAOS-164]TGD71301.1 NAD(P)/FAD-dependent oxidoreductase [Haliea sp. SAOS-164]
MNLKEQIEAAAADPDALRQAVAGAHVVPLLMSYVHLTGDKSFLPRVRPYIQGGWDYQQAIPEDLQAEIRAALVEAIETLAASGGAQHREPPREELKEMMDVACGADVPEKYLPIFYEETCFGGRDYRRVEWRKPVSEDRLRDFQVVIAGAGFSGVVMGIRLKQAGIPFVIIEKNDAVGGTWYENTYPGIGVDTPCHFYSFSLMPNPDWPEFFSKGPELDAYINRMVDHFGIREHIRFNEEVSAARYDEAACRWQVETRRADGSVDSLEANVFISAVGILNRPRIPAFPGLDTFKGPAFHSARWDHSVDITGKRVALIGTGATGIQVGPAIADKVGHLTIFQRSKHWVIRHPMYHEHVPEAVTWATKHIPYYMDWFRFQLFWAASDGFYPTLKIDPQWSDPEHSLNAENAKMREELIAYITSELGERTDLLDKVIPEYPPFGKRMLRDNNWFRMLCRDNVELYAGDVERIEEDGVVAGGRKYPADVLVFATGFHASRLLAPMDIVGRGGATIRERWGEDDPRAHLGITVPDFPNFYVLYGPNTNLAHGGSAFFHSECQVRYISEALREMLENDWDELEVRREPYEAYNEKVDTEHRQLVWSHPGVTSWYKNSSGRVIMNSPWRLADYRHFTADIDLTEYHCRRLDEACAATGSDAAGGA